VSAAEEIYTQFIRRIRQGELLDLEQLCRQNPEHAETLRHLHNRQGTPTEETQSLTPTPQRPTKTVDFKSNLPATKASNPTLGQGLSPTRAVDVHSQTDATLDFSISATCHTHVIGLMNSKGYKVQGEIDRGGMGVILRVWDENLKRNVAMKMILGQENLDGKRAASVSQSSMLRFIREAEITGRLDHPGVVPIHEIGLDDQGRQYFTMRLIHGESLAAVNRQLKAQEGNWTQTRVLEVIVKVCDTLAFAHSKDVIHRDLKPANIMVGQFGETYVMDWGLAKVMGEASSHDNSKLSPANIQSTSEATQQSHTDSSDVTLDGSVIGTPSYMSPEQAQGQINKLDARSDIYSVGTMLYELLTSVKPYSDNLTVTSAPDVLRSVNSGPPTPIAKLNRKVPSELTAICEKAMARDQQNRYGDMGAMAEDLRAYLENRVVRAYKTGAFAEFKKWVRRNRSVAIVAAVAGILLLVGLGTVIGLQRWSNLRIAQEKDAKHAALLKEQDARKIADQQRRFAEGLLLVSQSREAVRQNKPVAAMLLALESLDRSPGHQANSVLLDSLATNSEERRLVLHRGKATSAVFSPSGDSVLTAAEDHLAAVFDVATGQAKVLLVGHQNFVITAEYSPNGQLAVTTSYDGTAAIWDVTNGRRNHVLPHDAPVMIAQFSPNGTKVATGSFDNLVRLWDVTSGVLLHTLTGHADFVRTLSFHPDGTHLISGSADMSAQVWNVESGENVAILQGHEQTVATAQFSRDGMYVITAAAPAANAAPKDRAARLWNAETWELDAELNPGPVIASAAISPDGNRIAVGCGDGTVRIWDMSLKSFVQLFEADASGGWLTNVRFSRDGRRLLAVTSSHSVVTWDVQTSDRTATAWGHSDTINSARFSADGQRIVTTSKDESIRIWKTDQGDVMPHFRHDTEIQSVSAGSNRLLSLGAEASDPRLWSIETRKLIAALPHTSAVYAAKFSRGGDLLLTTTFDGAAYLWSTRDGELLHELANVGASPTVTFGLDDRTVLISSFRDKKTTQWNIETGEKLREFLLPDSRIQVLGPNGRYVVAMGATIRILDATTGQDVVEFPASGPFVNAQFFADGSLLRLFPPGGSLIEVWHVPSGKRLQAIDLGNAVKLATITPNGETLLANSPGDLFIRRFRISDGQELERMDDLKAPIDWMIVSPDGARLVTKASDNSARLWDLESGKQVRLLSDNLRSDVLQFSTDSRHLVTGRQRTTFVDRPYGVQDVVSLWNASTGHLEATLIDHAVVRDACLTKDSSWIVTIPRNDGSSVRLWPIDPPTHARQFITRSLSADERELHQIGTAKQRKRRRRQNELDFINSRLAPLALADFSSKPTHEFLDKTLAELRFELGTEPSQSELDRATENLVGLLRDANHDSPVLRQRIAEQAVLAGNAVLAIESLELAVQHPDGVVEMEIQLDALRSGANLVSFASIDESISQEKNGQRISDLRKRSRSELDRRLNKYLEARLQQKEKRFKLASEGFRAVLAEDLTRAEPHLRLAECLFAQHQTQAATTILREALKQPTCRTREVWNQWLANALLEGKTPSVLLEAIDDIVSDGSNSGQRYAQDLKWLLKNIEGKASIRINCGGGAYVDSSGRSWGADRLFTHGFHFFGGEIDFSGEIEESDDDPLYQTERFFDQSRKALPPGYRIPLPAGRYRVQLHFAEIYESGVRLFDVRAENRTILVDYDPSENGFATAQIKTAILDVNDGLLDLEFIASREAAKISAIEIDFLK
jgi:WD40 repeat protein/serine/threonine protein kinase